MSDPEKVVPLREGPVAGSEDEGGQKPTEEPLDITGFVGLQIRERRRFAGMTIAEMSRACDISISNLSKIENGQVSASLQSLSAIAQALSTPVHALLQGFDDEGTLFHIPAGKGLLVGRPGKSGGHSYELLANNEGQLSGFTPYLVTLEEQSKQRATFTHAGMEFIHMLSGGMQYRYGTRLVDVQEGDSLILDARTPHGPERILRSPGRYLALIMQKAENREISES